MGYAGGDGGDGAGGGKGVVVGEGGEGGGDVAAGVEVGEVEAHFWWWWWWFERVGRRGRGGREQL